MRRTRLTDEMLTTGEVAGAAYENLGQVAQARQCWQEALRIFEEIKSPHAQTVRQWLASLAGEP